MHNSNQHRNLDMKLWIYQKLNIKCLFNDIKVQNYIECRNINFILNEESIRKIKNSTLGNVKIIEILKKYAIH